MYYYEPKLPKKKERLLFFSLVAVAAVLFGIAAASGMPYPWIPQSVGVCLLVGAILLLTQCLSVRYAYAIEQGEGAPEEANRELTVTRFCGKRMTVVCRISLSDIEEVTPVERSNRRHRRELTRGKCYYRYTACLFDGTQILLLLRENDQTVCVQILSDDRLSSLLKNR